MLTKIQKWGNSQGLRFTKALLEEAQIQVGDEVQVSVQKGRIRVASGGWRCWRPNCHT